MIKVKFFAAVRDRTGCGELEVGANLRNVSELDAWLRQNVHQFSSLDHNDVYYAVDHSIAHRDTVLKDGCEVAVFPPVTGG